MFGHDDDDNTQNNDEGATVVQPISSQPADEKLLGVADDSSTTDTTAPVAAATDPDGDIDKIVNDINADAEKKDNTGDVPVVDADDSLPADAADAPGELIEIRKSALKELSPLLSELDQAPDEKLDILMMAIQASDDQSLIPQDFEMAKKIENKKQRAEAMLDIINEINYFTKKK